MLHENISPNKRFCVIYNYCAGAFDLYLADREASNPEQRLTHLLRLPMDTWAQGGDNATLPVVWSPDGRWLIYDNGNQSVYLLDIETSALMFSALPSPEADSVTGLFVVCKPI